MTVEGDTSTRLVSPKRLRTDTELPPIASVGGLFAIVECLRIRRRKTMNWQSQLTQLILNYYRENTAELEQLNILRQCKLTRRWRSLRIECHTASTALALRDLSELIREPIAQLRIARHIKFLVKGDLVATVPVQSCKPLMPPLDARGNDADLLL